MQEDYRSQARSNVRAITRTRGRADQALINADAS